MQACMHLLRLQLVSLASLCIFGRNVWVTCAPSLAPHGRRLRAGGVSPPHKRKTRRRREQTRGEERSLRTPKRLPRDDFPQEAFTERATLVSLLCDLTCEMHAVPPRLQNCKRQVFVPAAPKRRAEWRGVSAESPKSRGSFAAALARTYRAAAKTSTAAASRKGSSAESTTSEG